LPNVKEVPSGTFEHVSNRLFAPTGVVALACWNEVGLSHQGFRVQPRVRSSQAYLT
jgi:hypothetical protein